MRKPYEVFEHTADIGIHAYGSTLEELFIHAAEGMESLMVAPEQLRITTSRQISVEDMIPSPCLSPGSTN
ncbi:hypothetical protein KDW_57640 [Dictyobacter vulcani]|uniref:Archease domain-containing protein n=1 Tax=Dictyobacter vulcani TaxID=2607529 RepID=A0A5J4KWS9_9CHLR|nr:hypothetical protein KDW_57640 [Dictyobacter vulcani]